MPEGGQRGCPPVRSFSVFCRHGKLDLRSGPESAQGRLGRTYHISCMAATKSLEMAGALGRASLSGLRQQESPARPYAVLTLDEAHRLDAQQPPIAGPAAAPPRHLAERASPAVSAAPRSGAYERVRPEPHCDLTHSWRRTCADTDRHHWRRVGRPHHRPDPAACPWSGRLSESHSGRSFDQGVNWAFAGMMPSRFWLAKIVSRSLFQPSSKKCMSLIFLIHSGVG